MCKVSIFENHGCPKAAEIKPLTRNLFVKGIEGRAILAPWNMHVQFQCVAK